MEWLVFTTPTLSLFLAATKRTSLFPVCSTQTMVILTPSRHRVELLSQRGAGVFRIAESLQHGLDFFGLLSSHRSNRSPFSILTL